MDGLGEDGERDRERECKHLSLAGLAGLTGLGDAYRR